MPKIKYVDKDFRADALKIIEQANKIIVEYEAEGYDLTLRQLYYQFVSRDIIPNKDTEYKRLGSIINDARLAGLIDWNSIVDRTRNVRGNSHWDSPSDIVETCARQFQFDKWADQPRRIEVWIEKDALVGVIDAVCRKCDVAFFSCRGYTSQSEMWAAAQRLISYEEDGQETHILHLGDHDPSGIDMTRDIEDRLHLFGSEVEIQRLALNMDQVEEYNPPPNPAKVTDSRSTGYIDRFGAESWELDALEPKVLSKLIEKHIFELRDVDKWKVKVREELKARKTLSGVAERWDEVTEDLEIDVDEPEDEPEDEDEG